LNLSNIIIEIKYDLKYKIFNVYRQYNSNKLNLIVFDNGLVENDMD